MNSKLFFVDRVLSIKPTPDAAILSTVFEYSPP